MTTEYILSLENLPTAVETEKEPVEGTAVVDLTQLGGSADLLASGWIYGIPDAPNQIPDQFYTDVGFRYARAGGSQLPGSIGWIGGIEQYEKRFQSALSNYRTTRKHGGDFILLPAALWGADGGQAADAPYPGDNGDWKSWDDFLTRLMTDIKANNMLEGLVFDIWNESDFTGFWQRDMHQWLGLWERTFHRVRSHLHELRISGPSFAAEPQSNHPWWTAFLEAVARSGTIPDQWSWHMEGGEAVMSHATKTFSDFLQRYNLPQRPININEYATYGEQRPSASAWWISQLERHNAIGLRGNWAIGGQLHDFLAGLTGKPNAGTGDYKIDDAGYYPTAEFWVYKYYAGMRGRKVQTMPTRNEQGDVFATLDSGKLKVLAGTRATTGRWSIEIRGLEANGSVMVKTTQYQGSAQRWSAVESPVDKGCTIVEMKDGVAELKIVNEDPYSAYSFEFDI